MSGIFLLITKSILPTAGRCGRNGWIKILVRHDANTSGSSEHTLKYQETLPKFPVPPLELTCRKYLRQCRPLMTDQEYERTKKVVGEFCKPGGTGHQLQHALIRRSELEENWLSDWWRGFHLAVRQPNVLSLSPGLLMHRQTFSDLQGQIDYTAKLIFCTARFVSSLARHEFPPIKAMRQPICMDQFYMGFCGCRIPGRLVDTFHSHRVDSADSPRHIVVFRNNHMFKFDILDSKKIPLDAASILKQLQRIVNETHVQALPIGLVTAHERSKWADIYSKMKEDEINAQSLHDIQSSLLVVSLDQTESVEDTEGRKYQESRLTLCGGGSKRNSGNRWHDKSVQIFVGSNGECGIVGEHAFGDGVFASVLTQIVSDSIKEMRSIDSDSHRSELPSPQRVRFVVTDELICAIKEPGRNLDDKLACFETQEETFSSFGKAFLKSHEVFHDGFVQIAIQMTYWRLFGYFPAIFEAVSQQTFKLGRVEHIRTVTEDSAAFITMFHNEQAKTADKVAMLHKALEVHTKTVEDARMGQSTEKHFFGLHKIAEETKIDASEFFDDPSWKGTRSSDIRTASMLGDAIRAVYAPLIEPSCSFIWYSIKSDSMRFTITNRKDKCNIDVNNFLKHLSVCMIDLKNLLEYVSHGSR